MDESSVAFDLLYGMPEVPEGNVIPSLSCAEGPELLKLLQQERREAADREHRLLVRVDRLTKLVEKLTEVVASLELSCTQPLPSSSFSSVVKTSGSKSSKVTGSCSGQHVEAKSGTTSEQQPPKGHDQPPKGHDVRTPSTTSDDVLGTAGSQTSVSRSQKPAFKFKKFEDTEDDDDDSTWQLVTKKKPRPPKAVLYVGKLREDFDEEKMKKYLERRAKEVSQTVTFHSCSILNKESSVSAMLTVNKSDVPLVTCKDFWFRPAYCRKWKFDSKDEKKQNGDMLQRSEQQED